MSSSPLIAKGKVKSLVNCQAFIGGGETVALSTIDRVVMSHVMAQDGLLPPDSRTGFHWLLCSNPGDPEGQAPIGRSEGSCAASDGRRRWPPEARPPGSSVRSPRSWTEPGEQRVERRVRGWWSQTEV